MWFKFLEFEFNSIKIFYFLNSIYSIYTWNIAFCNAFSGMLNSDYSRQYTDSSIAMSFQSLPVGPPYSA